MSGMLSGLITSLTLQPFEYIKTQQQKPKQITSHNTPTMRHIILNTLTYNDKRIKLVTILIISFKYISLECEIFFFFNFGQMYFTFGQVQLRHFCDQYRSLVFTLVLSIYFGIRVFLSNQSMVGHIKVYIHL